MGSDKPSLSEALSAHPLLWRGNQVSHQLQTLKTGHNCLDEILPGGGWPLGAVTELVQDTTACGELSLLLPALARLSQKDHWITMIDPPWIPYPSALYARGLAPEKLLLVRTQNRKESLWACEQVVRGMPGGAMLAWPDELSFSELRRLQLAAKSSQKTVFLFRDQKSASNSSAAELRLQLAADNGGLKISVLKCRGQRPASSIHIQRTPLFKRLQTSPSNSNEAGKTSDMSAQRSLLSLPSSQEHALPRPSVNQ
jgi:protein ImuA